MRWLPIGVICAVGCATGAASGPLVPTTPTLASRCRVGASQAGVLVTEWSATEKANIQAALGGGAIAVAFSGCEMRLVPNCRLPGAYNWQRTTPTSERIEIKSDAELYAKLPLGAATLGGELKKSGELAVQTTVSGQARLADMQATMVPNDPSCTEATHIVDALSVGAFTLSAGGSESMAANASIKVIGEAKGSMGQSAKILRSAGNAEACSQATDESPSWDCASPLQVFLAPIPGRAEPEGPPGTVRVDFVSGHENQRWDVIIDDNAACTTPCARWVDPSRPLSLRTREEVPQKLSVGRIASGTGPLQLVAKPRDEKRRMAGFLTTSLGGAGVFFGGFSALFGSLADRDGLVTGGYVTAGIGAIAVIPGIYLLATSGAKVELRPHGSSGPIMFLTPAGIAGSF